MRRMINYIQVINLCVTRDLGGLVPRERETPHNLHGIFKQLQLCRKSALSPCRAKYTGGSLLHVACKPWVSHVPCRKSCSFAAPTASSLGHCIFSSHGAGSEVEVKWPRAKAVCMKPREDTDPGTQILETSPSLRKVWCVEKMPAFPHRNLEANSF